MGFLLAALHAAGFATLTHTPSPMGFLTEILGRPRQEKPYVLIPVGYPGGGSARTGHQERRRSTRSVKSSSAGSQLLDGVLRYAA